MKNHFTAVQDERDKISQKGTEEKFVFPGEIFLTSLMTAETIFKGESFRVRL